MYTTVGRLSSYISQGVYTVSGPFHPFGGAVDIVVVEQPDGSYKSTPWYVKFGKFQGVLKRREKTVVVSVNDVEANFHMYLDHKGEAYFIEDASDDDEKQPFSPPSGPSSGDEGHELALEYHKSPAAEAEQEQGSGAAGNDSGSDGEEVTVLHSSESLELQFPGDGDEVVDEGGAAATIKLDELLDEAVGIEAEKEAAPPTTPVAALLANSALRAIERVAEKPLENGVVHDEVSSSTSPSDERSGDGVDVCQLKKSDQQASVLSSKNGDYVVNSYEVTQAIDRSFVITGDSKEEVESKAKELASIPDSELIRDNDLEPEPEVSDDASNIGIPEADQVSVKLTNVHQEVILEPVEESSSAAKETAAETELTTSLDSVGISGSSSSADAPKVDEEQDLAENLAMSIEEVGPDESPHGKEETLSTDAMITEPVDEEKDGGVDSISEASKIPDEQATDAIDKTSSSSTSSATLSAAASSALTATSSAAASSAATAAAAANRTWGWWVWRGGGSVTSKVKAVDGAEVKVDRPVDGAEVSDTGKERSLVATNVDLSSAEVVLMSVDGHVVVAEQGEATLEQQPDQQQLAEDQPGTVQVLDKDILEVKTGSESAIEIATEHKILTSDAALHSSIATGLIRSGYWTSWKLTNNKTLIPTSEQLASLKLKPGRNKITFTFTTRVLGKQQVDARIYLWKWNTKAVISDVDGTITKSDVLGQVMPLVGRDWNQTGVARLFSAIKNNGYELIFLSARAISQAYLTRQFLVNLKQDGDALPDGPVVISPDGLFPSLYREVIRRAPHEFKIGCLEDIRALFPSECQPFYAGFGNRDTDEISYLKVGIPKGKIFIINPKGEVIVNNILDLKSYTSLHKLVNDMFPPVNLTEREDFNSWNFWKMPIPDVDDL